VKVVKTLKFEKGGGVHDPPAPIMAPTLALATFTKSSTYAVTISGLTAEIRTENSTNHGNNIIFIFYSSKMF